jgi:hypothetical protein
MEKLWKHAELIFILSTRPSLKKEKGIQNIVTSMLCFNPLNEAFFQKETEEGVVILNEDGDVSILSTRPSFKKSTFILPLIL